jgi:hypothetical protein
MRTDVPMTRASLNTLTFAASASLANVARSRPKEVGVKEDRPTEVRPTETRPAEVRPTEECSAEVRPAEVR